MKLLVIMKQPVLSFKRAKTTLKIFLLTIKFLIEKMKQSILLKTSPKNVSELVTTLTCSFESQNRKIFVGTSFCRIVFSKNIEELLLSFFHSSNPFFCRRTS